MNPDEVEHRLAPCKWPFYYGWMILAAGTVGVVTSAPGQTGGISPFTESLLTALGPSRVDLSAAQYPPSAVSRAGSQGPSIRKAI